MYTAHADVQQWTVSVWEVRREAAVVSTRGHIPQLSAPALGSLPRQKRYLKGV
jgi:hypothetical protein